MILGEQIPDKGGAAAGRARALFMVVTMAGLLLLMLLPAAVTGKLGLADGSFWFLDTYAILASNDAVKAGLDPGQPNPLDVFGRPHSYSGWWFALGQLGLTRDDNALVGGLVTGLFVLAVFLYVKPRTPGQAGVGALAVLAPVVLLAFNRANNDLVVFTVLVAGLLGLREHSPARTVWFGVAVVLATGLKFYPLVAGVALLTLAPARLRAWATVGTLLLAAAVWWSQWSWFRSAVIPVSDGVFLFGAGLWWRELGLTGWVPVGFTALLLAGGGRWLVRRGWCGGLAEAARPLRERAGFAVGALLLVGCWLAGISFAYRWVFALLLLPWLWLRAEDRSARVTLGLLLACLWLDGLFCLATNLAIGPMPLSRLRAIQHGYQLLAQPVNAGLMLLLSGWLWSLVATRLREAAPVGWRGPAVSPHWLLAAVLMGWMAFAVWPQLLLVVGIADFGRWFLDSHAVLAAVDAIRVGLDPSVANPLDLLERNHKYSDWWYALRWFGVTRDDNFLVGLLWVGGFALAAWFSARPRTMREALWLGLFLLSPAVVLAVNRANNDLVIFQLLALTGLVAGVTWWRRAGAALLLAVATGLKFYPVVAAGALLWVRPVRRMPGSLLLGLVAAGAALAMVWPQMVRGQFLVVSSIHTFGAALLCRELGVTDEAARWVAVLIVGAGGAALAATGVTRGLARRGGERLSLQAAMGLLVLLACFVAGVSYAYRWIFAWWMALWLWRDAGDDQAGPRERVAARLACGLLFASLWLDGLLSFLVNMVLHGMDMAAMQQLQRRWRLITQPGQWLLLMLFAGWLIEAAGQLLRAAWTERQSGEPESIARRQSL